MGHILIILSLLLLSSPLFGQSKPLGVVLPPTIIGNVSEARKQILLNTLDEEVSKYFDVSPSTNDGSDKLPVVSDVFQLQIIEEDGDTQLSLRWTSGDDRRVETQYCEGCKTFKLNGHLKELVKKLVGVEGVVLVKNNIVVRKKKGILFRDTPYSKFVEGGKKWFKIGDEKTQVKYEGEIVNGVPNGQGTMTCCDGVKYVGGYKDGVKNGQGTFTFGKGNWEGDKYDGGLKDGKFHGKGTYTSPKGYNFIGEYKDGKKHGQGTETWKDGKKYVGEYKDGKLNGQGTYTFPDGRKHVGGFKDGTQNGQGIFTWSNGNKYEGEWNGGKHDGQGTYTWSDGKKYVGEWKDGKYDGQGIFTWSNGNKYEGEWKDDKQNGQGTYIWSDGRKQNQVWKSGKLVNKKEQKSNEMVKYEEGKGLKIDGNALNKAIKKNECMKVAKLLPADDRLQYLRSCGVID